MSKLSKSEVDYRGGTELCHCGKVEPSDMGACSMFISSTGRGWPIIGGRRIGYKAGRCSLVEGLLCVTWSAIGSRPGRCSDVSRYGARAKHAASRHWSVPWDGGLSKRILSSRRLGGPAEILPVARRGSATRHRSTTIRDVIRARSRPCRPRPSTAHLISRADDNCHSERTRKMPRIVSGLFEGTSNKNPRGVSHVRGKQRNSHSHH
jgi:hypothetical protein